MSHLGQHLRIQELLPSDPLRVRTALDIGAADGLFYSNTLALEQAGWDVIAVEANPLLAPDLWLNRRRPLACAVGPFDLPQAEFTMVLGGPGPHGSSSYSALHPQGACSGGNQKFQVPVRSLNWILAGSGWSQLDLLSIDIEGGEFAALGTLDFSRWRPRLIVVENWACNDAFAPLLEPQGYRLIDRMEYDEFWLGPEAGPV